MNDATGFTDFEELEMALIEEERIRDPDLVHEENGIHVQLQQAKVEITLLEKRVDFLEHLLDINRREY
jgi:hypothetical protein